eukprot:1564472-Amphidinium_carterae.1
MHQNYGTDADRQSQQEITSKDAALIFRSSEPEFGHRYRFMFKGSSIFTNQRWCQTRPWNRCHHDLHNK